MQEKNIEFEKVIVRVQYNRTLTKEDLEESCTRFLKRVMRDKEKRANATDINTTRSICKK